MENSASNESRVGIIAAITAPLGFFALALLIVEAFLGTVLVGARETLLQVGMIVCVCLGVVMFVLVVGMVGILVWKKPENLTFDKVANLDRFKQQMREEAKNDRDAQYLLRQGMFYRLQKRYPEA